MGQLILEHEGTLERFTGDGIMVFFNDPVPMPDAAPRAVRMALRMQREVARLADGWQRRGYELRMGVGIAMGFATIGAIGFEGRIDYGAIGTVTNLAARLCAEAAGGEVLVPQRVVAALGPGFVAEPRGEIQLKVSSGRWRCSACATSRATEAATIGARNGLRACGIIRSRWTMPPRPTPSPPPRVRCRWNCSMRWPRWATRAAMPGHDRRHRGRTGAIDVLDP
jgi:hypothetical protein